MKVFVLAGNLCVKGPCCPGGWLNSHLPWQVENEFLGLFCFVCGAAFTFPIKLYSTHKFFSSYPSHSPQCAGGAGGCEGLAGVKAWPRSRTQPQVNCFNTATVSALQITAQGEVILLIKANAFAKCSDIRKQQS